MTLDGTPINTPQAIFDERYITAGEIQRKMKINRSSIIYARQRGLLPGVIVVKGQKSFIWEREQIEPYLKAWQVKIASRKGNIAEMVENIK